MAAPIPKKSKLDKPTLIFVLPSRIQKKRLELLLKSCKNKKLPISNNFDGHCTHVVTEVEDRAQALRSLSATLLSSSTPSSITSSTGTATVTGTKATVAKEGSMTPSPRCDQANIIDSNMIEESIILVKLSWLSRCIKAAKVLPAEEDDVVYGKNLEQKTSVEEDFSFPKYECQRAAPLEHQNHVFTDAFDTLQRDAEFREGENPQNYSRALAFRRAACVLRSFPVTVTSISQVAKLKDIGEHSRRVINEIIETGYCAEVDNKKSDPWFLKMQLFTGVFGVGPATARKWIDAGYSSITDVREALKPSAVNDLRLTCGLAFYEDLAKRMPKSEGDWICDIVTLEAEKLLSGVTVTLTGGFRRGKSDGHDVDLLISHPEQGRERGLLPQLLNRLWNMGLVFFGKSERNSFREEHYTGDSRLSYLKGQTDHFEKWIGIMKLPKDRHKLASSREKPDVKPTDSSQSSSLCLDENDLSSPSASAAKQAEDKPASRAWDLASEARDWEARRVDLIVVPADQYWYALVGWTGSKHFNRSLRLYAQRELGMKLTSHGLYSMAEGRALPANSEKEVFDHLKLPYFEPHLRNC